MLHFQGFWYYACWFTDTYSMNVKKKKKKKALVNKFVLLLLKLVKIAVLTADQENSPLSYKV